jgi:hypothetical protein
MSIQPLQPTGAVLGVCPGSTPAEAARGLNGAFGCMELPL